MEFCRMGGGWTGVGERLDVYYNSFVVIVVLNIIVRN